ncbi:SipW-dependent-type signal peptide-containing protein [Haloplanus sp. GCM10025708]|uniref:SipW-dependent-type signal peptide-containing protein n=1 Tax=Haloferacaceae TaxID=1644056 RepID=UPI003610D4E0
MTQPKRTFDLNRRKLLTGLGTIGLASMGAGLGTSAYFSDVETYEDNELTVGEFDLKLDWQQTYTGPEGTVYVNAYPDSYVNDPANPDQLQRDQMGFPEQGSDAVRDPIFTREEIAANLSLGVDDPQVESVFRSQFEDVPDYFAPLERALVEIDDVKPGDEGRLSFSLHLFDNPGYIWMQGVLLDDAENGVNEPESKDPQEDDPLGPDSGTATSGELADAIRVDVWYDADCDGEYDGDADDYVFRGSLADALSLLSSGTGIPLDADSSTPYAAVTGDDTDGDGLPDADLGVADGVSGARDCFANSTTYCVGFRWHLPVDHANEIQSDSVRFDVGFYAEQCRHNDGAGVDENHTYSTGLVDWEVVQSPDGTTGVAQTISAPSAWDAVACADWIDPYGTGGLVADPVGTYVYELTFEATEPAALNTLYVDAYGADNSVEFFLDGTSIGGSSGASAFADIPSNPTIAPVPNVEPGQHTLRAVVENHSGTGGNPAGLLVCVRLA